MENREMLDNMPAHARTQIWTILSALETIKEGD